MTVRWAIVVAIMYILSATTGNLVSLGHRNAIRNMFENASANGEPVIATCIIADNFQDYILHLYSIQDETIGLAPLHGPSLLDQIYFTDDRKLQFWEGESNLQGLTSGLWSVDLPNFIAHKVEPPVSRPIFVRENVTEPRSSNGRWRMKIESNSATLTDTNSNETTTFSIENVPRELWTSSEDLFFEYNFSISNDGNILIALRHSDPSGSNAGTVWKFQIEGGVWTNIIAIQGTYSCSVNSDGSLIGLTTADIIGRGQVSRTGYVIDAATGAIIQKLGEV
ncbi:MAG: hypothetical protein NTY09_03040 [bacterium]|nr:hypothetical protein [bacterium]